MPIQKIAVIGAGVMGSGIAAHAANSGADVYLFDIVAEGHNRTAIAEGAIKKLLKADPAALMSKKLAKKITPCNLEDHLDHLKECDWIIEAIVENKEIKQKLYTTLEDVRKPGSIISSNTSTIPLKNLMEGMADSFQQDFLITHFFNPPRYMRLLEVVAGEKTRPEAVAEIENYADRAMGKGVVHCKDTPGFIANRIGTFWIHHAATHAVASGITIEEADALIARPMGIPKTGVFGLMDLVGLDLIPYVMKSMRDQLPATDLFNSLPDVPDMVTKMIADGYTGRKGKGGFYRLNKANGKKIKEGIDLSTGEYRTSIKPKLAAVEAGREGLKKMFSVTDKYGTYAWEVMRDTLLYAASLVPEACDDITAIDEAMRLGYNWKFGPFELLDKAGPAWFAERAKADGKEIPALLSAVGDKKFYEVTDGVLHYFDGASHKVLEHPEGVMSLADVKRRSEPLAKNDSASLWDIGEGVVCLEFTSKMNSIDQNIFEMIDTAIKTVSKDYKALVIYNEGSHFSAGANLGMATFAASMAMWPMIEEFVAAGQAIYKALKYAPFPVVAAPSGIAVGGGCEILLHCDAVQAHAESYIGLVEVGVGLVPGWGGCKEMLTRSYTHNKRMGGPMPPLNKVFESIATAAVAKSAFEAKELMYLRDGDAITMNRNRLLGDAKHMALNLAENYTAPEPQEITLGGPAAKAAMEIAVGDFAKKGVATPYDVVICEKLSTILSGGDTDITETVSEDRLLELEREAFMPLVQDDRTLARIQSMLDTGKPLRN